MQNRIEKSKQNRIQCNHTYDNKVNLAENYGCVSKCMTKKSSENQQTKTPQ